MPTPETKLTRGPLADQIVDRISSQVFSGELVAGALLPPEQTLAASFGVSKTAVREAAKVLAAKGLVSIRQGVGTTVNPRDRWHVLDPHMVRFGHRSTTLADLVQARRAIEPEIAALAAQGRDAAALDVLREAVERGAAVTTVDQHVVWDMAFHQALADATDNPVLVILMNSIGQLLRASRVALFNVRGSVGRSSVHHRRIFETVAAADAAGSRVAMLAHLEQVADDCALLGDRALE